MEKVSCFIRKSTPEIRRELEDLGYITNINIANNYPHDYTNSEKWLSVNSIEYFPIRPHYQGSNSIDCGTNEDFFFALAALNGRGNYSKAFIVNGEKFHICQTTSMDNDSRKYGFYSFRPATQEEIINYFNDKELQALTQ